MKPIEIDTNSWHYKIAFSSIHSKRITNICEYRTAVITNLLLMALTGLLLSLMALGVAVIMVYGLMSVLFYFTHGLPLQAEFWLMCTFTAIILFLTNKMQAKNPSKSVTMEMYHSWKEKYCAKVEFK